MDFSRIVNQHSYSHFFECKRRLRRVMIAEDAQNAAPLGNTADDDLIRNVRVHRNLRCRNDSRQSLRTSQVSTRSLHRQGSLITPRFRRCANRKAGPAIRNPKASIGFVIRRSICGATDAFRKDWAPFAQACSIVILRAKAFPTGTVRANSSPIALSYRAEILKTKDLRDGLEFDRVNPRSPQSVQVIAFLYRTPFHHKWRFVPVALCGGPLLQVFGRELTRPSKRS